MQEIIVFTIASIALAYLLFKFVVKKKSHNCTKCDIGESKNSKKA
jgi:hypothetical protein